MDIDSYPEEHELNQIECWHHYDLVGLMNYVQKLWKYPEYFEVTEVDEVICYHISTGGWSGNESIISALKKNQMFWALCWQESRRGGHYKFEVKKN